MALPDFCCFDPCKWEPWHGNIQCFQTSASSGNLSEHWMAFQCLPLPLAKLMILQLFLSYFSTISDFTVDFTTPLCKATLVAGDSLILLKKKHTHKPFFFILHQRNLHGCFFETALFCQQSRRSSNLYTIPVRNNSLLRTICSLRKNCSLTFPLYKELFYFVLFCFYKELF